MVLQEEDEEDILRDLPMIGAIGAVMEDGNNSVPIPALLSVQKASDVFDNVGVCAPEASTLLPSATAAGT